MEKDRHGEYFLEESFREDVGGERRRKQVGTS
jgi:hypothetical protein